MNNKNKYNKNTNLLKNNVPLLSTSHLPRQNIPPSRKMNNHVNHVVNAHKSHSSKTTLSHASNSSRVKHGPNKYSYSDSLPLVNLLSEHYHLIRQCINRELPIDISQSNTPYATAQKVIANLSLLDSKAIHEWLVLESKSMPIIVPLPSTLVFPPKFNFSYWQEASDQDRIIPVPGSASMYLINFDIQDFRRYGSGSLHGNIHDRIIHGVNRQLSTCVKLRATTPILSVLIALLGYTCDSCETKTTGDANHRCYHFSPSLCTLVHLLSKFNDFPLYYGYNGISFNNNVLSPMTSQLPFLIFQLCEVSIAKSTRSIRLIVEKGLTEAALSRSSINLFGETFERKSAYSKLRASLETSCTFRRRELNATTVRFMGLINFHQYHVPLDALSVSIIRNDAPSYWQFISQYISYFDGERLVQPVGHVKSLLNDGNNDYVFQTLHEIYFFSGNLLYVTGIAALAIEDSAQGQIGYGQPLQESSEWIIIEGHKVPIRMNYLDPSLRELYELGLSMIPENPNYGNLESEFIELQTTNSSGMTPEVEASERELLSSYFDGNPEVARLVRNVRKTRIIDTLIEIRRGLSTKEGVAAAMAMPGKSGTRIQVYRRLRLIIMIRTVPQASGFLIMKALEAIYTKTRYSISGKNTGDVRDMIKILEISSSSYYKSSNDVKGMDASTKKSHLLFTLTLAFQSYGMNVTHGVPFFMGSGRNDVNYELVDYYVGDEITSVKRQLQISYPQLMIAYAILYFFHDRQLFDGTFNSTINISPLTFGSGWWPTSAQHTVLGCLALQLIQNKLADGTSSIGEDGKFIEIVGGVAGDDQTLGIKIHKVLSDEDKLDYSLQCSNMLLDIMNNLGFNCDPSVSLLSAEFLKQVGTLGSPEGLDGRLCIFSSERGDQYGNFGNVRYEEVLSIIREKTSRTAYPELWSRYLYLFGWVLPTVVLAISSTSGKLLVRPRYQARRLGFGLPILSSLDNFIEDAQSLGFTISRWNYNDVVYCALYPGPFWMCTDELGVPLPGFVHLSDSLLPPSSIYTTPSSAVTMVWCKMFARRREDMYMKYKDYFEQIKAGTILKKKILGVPNGRQYILTDTDIQMLLHNPLLGSEFILPFNFTVDVDKLIMLGVISGMLMRKLWVGVEMERLTHDSPIIDEWKKTGQSYLNQKMVRESVEARDALFSLFQIRVPKAATYAFKIHTKVDQALIEVIPSEEERGIGIGKMINNMRKCKNNYINDLNIRFAFGGFSVDPIDVSEGGNSPIKHPEFSRGWGLPVRAGSELSYILSCYGLPMYSNESQTAIKDRIVYQARLPGDPTIYAKLAKQAIIKKGNALELLATAIGVSHSGLRDLRALGEGGLSMFNDLKLTILPRLWFFTNYNVTTQLNDHIIVPGATRISRRLRLTFQYLALSLLHMYPHNYCGKKMVVTCSDAIAGIR